jgi:hypothetical protein
MRRIGLDGDTEPPAIELVGAARRAHVRGWDVFRGRWGRRWWGWWRRDVFGRWGRGFVFGDEDVVDGDDVVDGSDPVSEWSVARNGDVGVGTDDFSATPGTRDGEKGSEKEVEARTMHGGLEGGEDLADGDHSITKRSRRHPKDGSERSGPCGVDPVESGVSRGDLAEGRRERRDVVATELTETLEDGAPSERSPWRWLRSGQTEEPTVSVAHRTAYGEVVGELEVGHEAALETQMRHVFHDTWARSGRFHGGVHRVFEEPPEPLSHAQEVAHEDAVEFGAALGGGKGAVARVVRLVEGDPWSAKPVAQEARGELPFQRERVP